MALVLGGRSIRQIESSTGISRTTVERDVNLKAAAAQCPQTIEYRELHRERLNQMLFKWWPRAIKDLAALYRVLKLLRQEAGSPFRIPGGLSRLDERARAPLTALKRCALGLDLYLWLVYRTFALRAPGAL